MPYCLNQIRGGNVFSQNRRKCKGNWLYFCSCHQVTINLTFYNCSDFPKSQQTQSVKCPKCYKKRGGESESQVIYHQLLLGKRDKKKPRPSSQQCTGVASGNKFGWATDTNKNHTLASVALTASWCFNQRGKENRNISKYLVQSLTDVCYDVFCNLALSYIGLKRTHSGQDILIMLLNVQLESWVWPILNSQIFLRGARMRLGKKMGHSIRLLIWIILKNRQQYHGILLGTTHAFLKGLDTSSVHN